MSIPKYIPDILHKFQSETPKRRQYSPHAWAKPAYGAKEQYASGDKKSPVIPPD